MATDSALADNTISIIGGTGNLGAAIGRRLAKAGHQVILGSRSQPAAQAKAEELGFGLKGMTNADAAAAGDIILLTVPFSAHSATLAEIAPHVAGKIVCDTTVPLVPPKITQVALPSEGSAAVAAQRQLGEDVRMVSAFHNVAAHKLATDDQVACDVLVFGNDAAARGSIVELAGAMGLRGLHGGALANSAAAEAMTSVLIFLNKTYKIDGAGLQITGSFPQSAD